MEAKVTAAILVCFHLFSEIENVVKKEKFFCISALDYEAKISYTIFKS